MKETWVVYDNLRRFWWLLLLGMTIGAVAGLGIHIQRDNPTTYQVMATIIVSGTRFSLQTGQFSTEAEATEDMTMITNIFDLNSSGEIQVDSVSVRQTRNSSPAWKATVLGAVIAGLLSIASIFVWNDARSYRQHLREREPRG